MTIELWIWLGISLVGVAGLPFVIVRRRREILYYRVSGTGPIQPIALEHRNIRAAVLSAGIIMSTAVAVVAVLLQDPEDKRVLSVLLLIGVELTLVIALWLDEWYAVRIDRAAGWEKS